jgi:outer membrane receptor protein involved in Fe transport
MAVSELNSKTSRSGCVALAVALAATSSPAQEARPTTGTQDGLDEVVVVGSRIRGLSVTPPSPVRVFDKLDIDQTGAATVQQFLEKLPQNFGGGANAGNVANSGVDRDVTVNDGRGSSINLRGLGTGTTLTLLNGRRLTASNQFQYVDVSLIPVSAIERIEVLTDGASAIYGADAIGGVVNIVLRNDFDGYETLARYGSVTTGGLQEFQGALTGGWKWGGGNALLSYEYLSQDNLEITDRDFSVNPPLPFDLYPKSERNSVYGRVSQALTSGLVLEVSGIYSRRDVTAIRGFFTDFETNVPNTEQYDLSAGLTYDLPARWQARAHAALGRSFVENTGFRTTTTGVLGVISQSSQFRITSDSWSFDVAADGPLFALPGGEAHAAIGATYRDEGYEFASVSGAGVPRPGLDAVRGVTSVFGEVVMPVVGAANRMPGIESLVATGAVRYDRYSDFGSTVNPKVGIAWELTPALLVRGTYGTSFRAPVFQDLTAQTVGTTVSYFPDPRSTLPSGRTVTMLLNGGDPDLGPERADTWTAGIEIKPDWLQGLAVGLNYYNIRYRDRIDRGGPANISTIFLREAPFAAIITRNPSRARIDEAIALGRAGAQYTVFRAGPFGVPAALSEFDTTAIVDNRTRNNASTFQDGIDLDARYDFDVGDNRIGLSIAGQYILNGTRQVTATSPDAQAINLSFLPVDLKFRTGANFSRGGWTAAAFVNYTGGYTDLSNTADSDVEAWTTVDLDVRYAVPASDATFLGNTSFALSIQNLLDADPPFVVTNFGIGFDPVNANPLGRFASFTVTKKW